METAAATMMANQAQTFFMEHSFEGRPTLQLVKRRLNYPKCHVDRNALRPGDSSQLLRLGNESRLPQRPERPTSIIVGTIKGDRLANNRRICYLGSAVLQTCKGSRNRHERHQHPIDVIEETLYEAIAAALASYNKDTWVEEI